MFGIHGTIIAMETVWIRLDKTAAILLDSIMITLSDNMMVFLLSFPANHKYTKLLLEQYVQ
jgi:hypothetical protein